MLGRTPEGYRPFSTVKGEEGIPINIASHTKKNFDPLKPLKWLAGGEENFNSAFGGSGSNSEENLSRGGKGNEYSKYWSRLRAGSRGLTDPALDTGQLAMDAARKHSGNEKEIKSEILEFMHLKGNPQKSKDYAERFEDAARKLETRGIDINRLYEGKDGASIEDL